MKINNLIKYDTWIHFDGMYEGEIKEIQDAFTITGPGKIKLKFKIINFEKVDISNFEENIEIDDADLWCLSLKVVALNPEKIEHHWMNEFIIIDNEGFKFSPTDGHEIYLDEYSSRKGWDRFFGQELSPKIPTNGAIFYQIPYGENNLSLNVRSGVLEKIIEHEVLSIENK